MPQDGRWRRWTAEETLEAIRLWAWRLGRPPLAREWERSSPDHPSAQTVRNQYGSWALALAAADLPPREVRWGEPEIIAALAAWTARHGRPPRDSDWSRAGEDHPSISTVARRFGSLRAALAAAELPTPQPTGWSEARIIAAVGEWAQAHGRAPRSTDWIAAAPDHPTTSTVRARFGGFAAAVEAAGLGPVVAERWSPDRIVSALQAWTRAHGHSPGGARWSRAAPEHPNRKTVISHFGSWQAALRAAGLAGAPRTRWREWSDSEIVDALRAWEIRHGRAPSAMDWAGATYEHPTSWTVTSRFGDWHAALARAGLRASRRVRWQGKLGVVAAIRAWVSAHDTVPTSHEWRRGSAEHPNARTVLRVFGSWEAAIRAAGFLPAGPGPSPLERVRHSQKTLAQAEADLLCAWREALAAGATTEHARRAAGPDLPDDLAGRATSLGCEATSDPDRVFGRGGRARASPVAS